MPAPRDCPCHSKKRYKECCAPFHDGSQQPSTAAALMRSRYSAFALGNKGEYLRDTLAHDHGDRQMSPAELGRSRYGQRFLDLRILQEKDIDPNTAEVLFYARLFERGSDQSFVELSRFVREEGGWRYQRGDLIATDDIDGDPRALTREQFDALLAQAS